MWKSKTVWTGIAGLVAAAGGYATGEMGSVEALQLGMNALMGIFLRLGVEKIGQ